MTRGLVSSSQADVRASALKWVARDTRAHDDQLIPLIFNALKDREASVRNAALESMGWIYERHAAEPSGQEALAAVVTALGPSGDRTAKLVAVDLLRGAAAPSEYNIQQGTAAASLIAQPEIQRLIVQSLEDAGSGLRPQMLQVVEASGRLESLPDVVAAVGAALHDDNLTVRSDAADLLVAIDKKAQDEALRAQVHKILLTALEENDPNVQIRVSRALGVPVPPRKGAPPVLALSGQKVSAADVPYDFNYFTAFVQPLFVKKYRGEACVDCHTPQANASGAFRILAPDADGRYTLAQSRTNFVSMLAVINRPDPMKSPLLLKPLDPRTQEGKLRGVTHDGGVFWANQYDPDFEIVADWLKGAKLETPPDKQLDFAYFVQHVEPIFATPGPDGIACINCHSTHAILHLESPETREGKFSVEQLENNYQSAHRVVDEGSPANSFIVRKPTSLREGEPGGLSHAGGIRWPDKKDSWQYKALITWIGKKNLDTP